MVQVGRSTPPIRFTDEDDLDAISAIFAHYAENTAATFEIESPSGETWRARWLAAKEAGHPWFVAELEGAVAGYVTTTTFRPKPAYRATLESTIYFRSDAVGRGLGRPLYEAALGEAAARGFHVAVAGITLPNPTSVSLHERLGFTPVGVFEEIGHKLGAWQDVGWWQLRLQCLPSGPYAATGTS